MQVVSAFISAPDPSAAMPEGVTPDKDGNVFGGFTENYDVKKYVKKLIVAPATAVLKFNRPFTLARHRGSPFDVFFAASTR